MIDARKALPPLGAGALIFGAALLYHVTRGINPQDESWFLQVTARVAGGEVLYRDVAFGVTPLSVYVATLLVKLFGVEVLVIKALNALCFTATLLLCVHSAAQLGLSRETRRAVGAAYLLYALPANAMFGAPYTPMAILLFVACFDRALAWLRDRDMFSPAAAAVFAGLCFGAKQNMGVLAIGALVVSVAIVNRRAAALALGGAVATVLLVHLPIVLTGALPQLVDYGFTGKGTYVALGGISLADGFMSGLRSTQLGQQLYWPHQYLFAPVAFSLLLLSLRRAEQTARTAVLTLLVFSIAAFAAVFPRADTSHLTIAHPLIILALAYGGHALWRKRRHVGKRVVYAWLGAGLLLLGATRVRNIWRADAELSSLPHFRGVLIERSLLDEIGRTATALRAVAPTNELFLLSPRAGLYYLASGLSNPTPYDYPYITTFGSHGEAEVIAAVRRGTISACLDPLGDPVLTAWALRRAIEATSRCRL